MKYLYILFIGILVLVSLVWVLRLGIEGKPVAKIKLSEFHSDRAFAQAVYMRLRQELKDHPIVFLGVDPQEPEHLTIWKEFLDLANEPGWHFDEVIVEKNLDHSSLNPSTVQVLDIKSNELELKQRWTNPAYAHKRIAVIVPQIYSSQLLKDNPIHRLMQHPNDFRFLSLTLVHLGKTVDEPQLQRIPCVAQGADIIGTSALGCAIRNKAQFWRRPLKEGIRLGIVEQYGQYDFLLFFRPLKPISVSK